MRNAIDQRWRVTVLAAATVVAIGAVPAGQADSAAACTFEGAHTDVLAELLSCDESSLQRLFRSLSPGAMPGWGVSARGHWRTLPSQPDMTRVFDEGVNQLVWHGKTFYTNTQGGFLVNRVLGDRPGFPAAVQYGPARLDGEPAIIVDYETTGDTLALVFRDEIRQVTEHLYLGFGWWNHEPAGWQGPDHITFVLDFRDPQLTNRDCLLCLVNREVG